MQGLVIRHDPVDPTKLYTIAQSLVVPCQGYVVLGNNADMATNGSVKVDLQYTGVSLVNTTDILSIQTAGVVPLIIDTTTWNDANLHCDGQSRNLDPNFLTAAQNDTDTNWCLATSFIMGNAGDTGTPGKPNDACQ
jgi:hypothetical protein